MMIWGNHNPTMVPDYTNAKLDKNNSLTAVETAVDDKVWLDKAFMERV
jgi:hypothetical protein